MVCQHLKRTKKQTGQWRVTLLPSNTLSKNFIPQCSIVLKSWLTRWQKLLVVWNQLLYDKHPRTSCVCHSSAFGRYKFCWPWLYYPTWLAFPAFLIYTSCQRGAQRPYRGQSHCPGDLYSCHVILYSGTSNADGEWVVIWPNLTAFPPSITWIRALQSQAVNLS